MDAFALMKNDYIEKVSGPTAPKNKLNDQINLKNTLKITKNIPANILSGPSVSGTIYGLRLQFDLESLRIHNGLSKMMLKIYNMTYSGPVAFADQTNVSDSIVKNVTLRTKSGTTLMYYDFNQTKVRLDEYSGTVLDSYFDDITGLTSNTDTVSYVPIFTFNDEQDPLDLRPHEPIELIIETNNLTGVFTGPSPANTPIVFTGADFQLQCTFFDDIDPKGPILDGILPQGPALIYPKQTMFNSYDIYYEGPKSITIPNTESATITFNLTCPYPSYVVHVAAMRNVKTFWPISRLVIENNNSTFVDQDYDTNFQYGSWPSLGETENQAFSYWFSKKISRKDNTGLLSFSTGFETSKLSASLGTNSTGGSVSLTVYVWFEYKTEFEVSGSTIIRKLTGLFKGGGPQLLNF